MRKIMFLLLMAFVTALVAGNAREPGLRVIADRGSSVTVEFILNGYDLIPENINGRSYTRIVVPGAVSLLKKGFPDLPTVCRNIIVPDEGVMDYRVLDADYEIRKIDPVAPSKGNLYRNVDPKRC